MALITDAEAAKRLARTIASDIALYNQEKIKSGIENDNLFDILVDELDEGKSLYASRVSPELAQKTNFFNIAIVDIIVKRSANIQSKIW